MVGVSQEVGADLLGRPSLVRVTDAEETIMNTDPRTLLTSQSTYGDSFARP